MKNNVMKQFGGILVVGLIIFVFCLFATGCSPKPQDTIVGEWGWYIDDGEPLMKVTFYNDNTVDMDGWYTATYEIKEESLKIETDGISLNYKCTFNDDGDKMYWTDPSDKTFGEIVFVKM